MRIVVAILLLLCSPLYAVEPVAVISPAGPINIPAGMGFVVSSDGSTHDTDKPSWHVSSIIGAVKGEQLIFVGPAPGVYQVELTVGGIVGGKVKLSSATTTVTVGPPGPGPNPIPPNPVPPVPPGPGPAPLPDGRFKLAQFAFDKASSVAPSAKSMTGDIASNFEAVASAAAAGAFASVTEMHNETAAKNVSTTGALRPAWLTALFEPLQIRLKELNTAGQLKTLPDHVAAWNEIAQGLRRAAGG